MKKAFSKKRNGMEILSRLQVMWKKRLSVLCVFYCVSSALWKLNICVFFLFRIYNVKNHKFAKFTTSSVIDSGDDLWKIRKKKKQPTTDVKHTRGGSLSFCQ